MQKIYIYNDYGASQDVGHVKKFFSRYFANEVCFITAAELNAGEWMQSARMLIMPGGFDLGFKKKLEQDTKAYQKIIDYVAAGGVYVGICAGAYYACDSIFFTKSDGSIIDQARVLKFSKSLATGPLFPYEETNYSGARVLELTCFDKKIKFLYNGGPVFTKCQNNEEILATWNKHKMMLLSKFGKGKALLSSVHFEFDYASCEKLDKHLIKELSADHNNFLFFAARLSELLR